MLNKTQLVRWASSCGNSDVSFTANVILTHHSRPTSKLRGLHALVTAGCSVRVGHDFSLIVDGETYRWEALEKIGSGQFSEVLAQYSRQHMTLTSSPVLPISTSRAS